MSAPTDGYLGRLLPGILADFERQAREQKYFDNPTLWAKDHLGINLWYKQTEIADAVATGPLKSCAVRAGHGVGKDLPLDTAIATPTGWSTIGSLRIGDEVFDEKGRPTRVVGKSEVFNLPLYEVTFSDGAKLRTSSTHEWNTIDQPAAKKIRRQGPMTDWRDHWDVAATRETGEIAETLTYSNGAKAGANHIIPISGALELPERPLPLDPYVTGAWLGDGTSVRPEMSIGEDGLYIIEEFAKAGYALTKTRCGKYRYTFARQGAREILRDANLMNNKHIPSDYQRASIAQRRDLLRGLMDTDGFVCNGSVCGIDLMNRELAYDVVELIRGLGARATITPSRTYLDGRDVGTRYRIVFNPTWSPFTAGRYKDQRFNQSSAFLQKARRTMRTVTSVRPVASVPTQCIQVEAESHLYLAGEDLIPTHNSFLSAVLVCWWVATRPIQYLFVASTAPSADQVSAILWREIRGMWSLSHKRHAEYLRLKGLGLDTHGLPDKPLPGYVTSDNRWKDDLGNLIAQGRKPPDFSEDSFQGIHAQWVLAIGDEACGLNENMIDSLANITSNEKSRRLLIANPTNPRSRFGEICLDPSGAWSLHHISVLDSPNFHGGNRCTLVTCPERWEQHSPLPHGLGLSAQALESLTDESYVTEKKLEYGEDSARYKARVLGEFAYDSGNNLFTDFEMAKARDAIGYIDYGSDGAKAVLGVDVARSLHGDSTFIYSFTTALMHKLDDEDAHSLGVSSTEGGVLRKVDSFRGVPLVDRFEVDGTLTIGQATLIHQHAIDLGASEIRVDSGGLGVGLIDGLKALSWDQVARRQLYRVIEIQGGGATPDGRSWINNRAYQYDQMKNRFAAGLVDIDPADKTLIQQLEDILYEFVDPHNAMKIESKISMKKRGVKSPDAADAAWYACADLSHLDGPQDGDVVTRSPSDQIRDMALSGFLDAYPM